MNTWYWKIFIINWYH